MIYGAISENVSKFYHLVCHKISTFSHVFPFIKRNETFSQFKRRIDLALHAPPI